MSSVADDQNRLREQADKDYRLDAFLRGDPLDYDPIPDCDSEVCAVVKPWWLKAREWFDRVIWRRAYHNEFARVAAEAKAEGDAWALKNTGAAREGL